MNWEPVIGLEIHMQLATTSKIFSGAANQFGEDPNTNACAVDLGLPGVLPVLNEEAVRMAVKFGLAIGAQINLDSIFDRKNYFYADLPKGYQISQFETPIVGAGSVNVVLEDGSSCAIGVTRAHLEEDPGKSTHDLFAGQTALDFNRSGTPLLEIVSEPDMRSAAEAVAYFKYMHTLVRYLQICDGNLSQGSMRCDANISVRPVGQEAFGERTEIKNMNSFRFVERAIRYEIERHIDVLESGGTIERETRLYDPDRDETRRMRGKESSEDYRYFPDPDLLPLKISEDFVDAVRSTLPELPEARQKRYIAELELSEYDANWLIQEPQVASYFEEVTAVCQSPKLAANWIMGELSAHLNKSDVEIANNPIRPGELGALINRVSDDTLSSKTAKSLFEHLWNNPAENGASDRSVDTLIDELGLGQMNDSDALAAVVQEVINKNPDQVAQLKAGKDKVLGFFVGQVMKATQGKANPKQVNELIRELVAQSD